MKEQIPQETVYFFRYKIIRTKKRNIFLGVINQEFRVKSRSSFSSGFAIAYGGKDGKVWYGNVDGFKVEGEGFREGDIVKTSVNLQKGEICW